MTFMSCSAAISDGIPLRFPIEGSRTLCGGLGGVCARGVLALGSHRSNRSRRARHRHATVFARRRRRRRPSKWQRPWWKTFFSDWNEDDESLDGWREEDELLQEIGSDKGLSEDEKFKTWTRKAEAIVDLREAQQDAVNAEERSWENWIGGGGGTSGTGGGGEASLLDQITDDPAEIVRDKSVFEVFRGSIDEDYEDMLFEDRVFMYASTNSAKFLALLIVVPWVIDFIVHDYVMMPFLERYVQKVPLAAELLDVRRTQKLQMVKALKIEKARYRLEVEIGKSPPLSDEEVWYELREKAIELRDDWRLENRNAFANIWSDTVYGIVLFLLMCFNQSKVAMLKFTGYKLLNNISDSGKAFLIILVSDILLGYHSESGWHTLVEVILEHYGFEADEAAVTFFVCLVPVALDVYIKFWVYKYLPRLSPSVGNVLDEIKRH
ncbi:chloroplast envelope membrane protein [Zea mays]|uniref:CemA-like proton extrusion protein-related n=1 Tax=Zea mays TaxID=4577 RepID=A0A1D6JKT1_MAIZE|nr:chloroplast envelope membrane protein [Zea mays]ONL92778.1 CemA-like proton extrusion protein-related [Zea mays]|eukprot:XP_008649946.1 chloroplast envelope membrane protein [Zea mays]